MPKRASTETIVKALLIIAADMDAGVSDRNLSPAALREAADRLEEQRLNAERFRKLQKMSTVQAQAFFWNYQNRDERAAAIDAMVPGMQACPM